MIPEKGEGGSPLPFFGKVCKKYIQSCNILFILAFLYLYLVFLL